MDGRVPRAASIAFEPRAEDVETMGLDVIGILSILVVILGVELTMGLLVLRGIGDLQKDVTERMDGLSRQIDAFHRELRDELKREIAGVRDELKREIAGVRTN